MSFQPASLRSPQAAAVFSGAASGETPCQMGLYNRRG